MIKQLLCGLKLHLATVAVVLACVLLTAPEHSCAQVDPVEDIENLFSKDEVEPAPVPSATPVPQGEQKAQVLPEGKEIKDVSDLGKLQAFKDIAVIQKRYLPKSERWEFYIAPALNLNDAFFLNFGASARFGYYFRERYGVEAIYTFLTVSERQVTEDLYKRGVKTASFVSPKGYYGLDFKWAPIYGKMTFQNKNITPFDLYFSFGLGMTSTNQDSSDLTLHIGTGQSFALTKSSAVRWDFSWYAFSAKSKVEGSGSSSLYHNLLITLGWSLFFPEASYR